MIGSISEKLLCELIGAFVQCCEQVYKLVIRCFADRELRHDRTLTPAEFFVHRVVMVEQKACQLDQAMGAIDKFIALGRYAKRAFVADCGKDRRRGTVRCKDERITAFCRQIGIVGIGTMGIGGADDRNSDTLGAKVCPKCDCRTGALRTKVPRIPLPCAQ